MDFTREPIIECVITAKEGCKLVVRSSKGAGQEEYFVDALEVVSFGHQLFYRCLEKPKSFFVPTNDYEVIEVREPRLVLKNVGLDRSIKIGGGREATMRHAPKEPPPERERIAAPVIEEDALPIGDEAEAAPAEAKTEGRGEKKRERRRHYRRRRGREDGPKEGEEAAEESSEEKVVAAKAEASRSEGEPVSTSAILSSLLAPPPTLISETIARYKDNELFKGVFFLKDEHQEGEGDDETDADEAMTFASSEEQTEEQLEEGDFAAEPDSEDLPELFIPDQDVELEPPTTDERPELEVPRNGNPSGNDL